jgi:hypothetical protein
LCKVAGFLREERDAASSWLVRSRVLISCGIILLTVFLSFVFYLRESGAAGSSHTYLYLEVGGTLLSFCYAANALVRFRGTHDRTALILAFGFVLSGIIETVGYFGLNEAMASGSVALSSIPAGWMVSRTLWQFSCWPPLRWNVSCQRPGSEQRDRSSVAGSCTCNVSDSAAFLQRQRLRWRMPQESCRVRGTCFLPPFLVCRRLFPLAAEE